MIIKRLFQPTVIENEKEVNYKVTSFPSSEVEKLLSIDYVGGGVFGIENIHIDNKNNTIFFCQPHFKVNWKESVRDSIFDNLTVDNDITVGEFYLTKPSIFPISMTNTSSSWNEFCSIIPKNIDLFLQLLLVYRQDNYKERLQEMYDDYCLNGIESPSNSRFVRKIQRGITEKIDSLLKWENNHLPIEEFENKINENCFRLNMRLIVKGDTERERKKAINGFKEKLNEYSYMNDWDVIISKLTDDTAEEIRSRKLNNIGKHQVFSMSELIPFLTLNETKQKEVVNVVVEEVKNKTESNVSNLIELLPSGNNTFSNNIDVEELAKKISKALKKVKDFKGELIYKDSIIGTTLIKLFFKLPRTLKYSDLIKKATLDDLKMYSGYRHLEISQSDKENEFVVSIPNKNRSIVYLRDCLTEEFMKYSEESELGFIAGVGTEGEILMRDLAKGRHLLIGSETGGGKSSFINQLLLSVLLTKKPTDVQIFMIDPKFVEFEMFRNFKHVAKIVNSAEEGISLLKQVINEMNRRYRLFQKVGVKDILQYNKKYPNDRIPYLLTVIDEYSELSLFNNAVHDYVISISQLGRSAGCCLILSTQDPRKEVIPPLVKSNMPSKVAFKCSNRYSYQTFLPKQPPKLFGQGHGVLCFTNQQEDFIEFQSCLITDGNEVELVEEIARRMDYEKVVLELPKVVEETEEESDLNRLKRCIVQNNTTKISEIQKLLKMNINKINSLMKELCTDNHNFLKAPEYKSQGYQLIASEEEIMKVKNTPTKL